jgi:predicted small secreted protein
MDHTHTLDPALPVKETFVKIQYLMLLMLVALAAAGCNTTKGFGQDVEATGDAIEDTADDAMDDDDR